MRGISQRKKCIAQSTCTMHLGFTHSADSWGVVHVGRGFVIGNGSARRACNLARLPGLHQLGAGVIHPHAPHVPSMSPVITGHLAGRGGTTKY